MLKHLKNMIGTTVGVAVGGVAIQQVGNLGSAMGRGLQSATQSFVSIGVMSHAAKGAKKLLKW